MACLPERLPEPGDHVSDANAVVSKQDTERIISDTYLSGDPTSLRSMMETFNVQLVTRILRLAWAVYRIS
jgi:hypothetical protein